MWKIKQNLAWEMLEVEHVMGFGLRGATRTASTNATECMHA